MNVPIAVVYPYPTQDVNILMLQTLMDHSASVHGVKVVPPVRKSPLSPFERTATLPWASAVKLLSASVVITAARTARGARAMMPDRILMILAPWVRNLNMVSSDYQR